VQVLQTNLSRSANHDVEWILRQAKRETDAIGFIPSPTVWRLHHQGRLFTLRGERELLGWLAHGRPRPRTKLYQVCVRPDVRRLLNATALCDYVARRLWIKGASFITLRCGDDLAANWFWRAVGFAQTDQTKGGLRRGRIINHYEAQIGQEGLITPPTEEIGLPTSLLTSADRPTRPQTPTPTAFVSSAAASSNRLSTTHFTRSP